MGYKINIVMPYWERSAATRHTLETYDKYYADDVRVIIVDDGSPKDKAKQLEDEFERLKVIELPIKWETKNPCRPINVGMLKAISDGDVVGLTNPETFHESPVIYEMRDMLVEENDYVLAPAFCPQTNEWHCHPEFPPPDIPPGTGFHHMALFFPKLWVKIGGMDEEYRDGYCFDDTDLVMRLVGAGANFMFSESAVIHSRAYGAKAPPPALGWERNHRLFLKKWRGNSGDNELHRAADGGS